MSEITNSLRSVLPAQPELFEPATLMDRHNQCIAVNWPCAKADLENGTGIKRQIVPVYGVAYLGGVLLAHGVEIDGEKPEHRALENWLQQFANDVLGAFQRFEKDGRSIVIGLIEQQHMDDALDYADIAGPDTLWLTVLLPNEQDWKDFSVLIGWDVLEEGDD